MVNPKPIRRALLAGVVAAAAAALAVAGTLPSGAAVAPAAAAPASAAASAAAAPSKGTGVEANRRTFDAGTYLVQLAAEPLARYAGGVRGLAATKPAAGERLDAHDADARAYRRHLADERDSVLRDVPGVRRIYDYDVAFNGFAARLTGAQASELAAHSGVARVWKNEVYRPQTVESPKFLGLDGADGVWKERFGGAEHAGEGVVVGVVDSGFWPQSKSFAPLPEPRPDQAEIDAK